MFNFFYADIDENSICKAVHAYETGITPPAHYVPVNSDDSSILGKQWTGSEFVEVVE